MRNETMIGVKGAYSYQVIDEETNEVVVDVPENTNLILDNYLSLNRMMPSPSYLCIGAGVVTPPAVTDSDLGNQIKASNISMSSYQIHEDTSVYRIEKMYGTTDFTGFNGEQISELGIREGSGTGTLVTRALIKDSAGNPTTITVNPGQTLRLTYSLYIYLPKVLGSGIISTPHGDLHWTFEITASTVGSWGYYVNQFVYNMLGSNTQVRTFTDNYVENKTVTSSYDTVQRKATCSFSCAVATAQRTLTAGDIIWRTRNVSLYGMVLSDGAPDFVLPANYDMSFSYEVTWGRLP